MRGSELTPNALREMDLGGGGGQRLSGTDAVGDVALVFLSSVSIVGKNGWTVSS